MGQFGEAEQIAGEVLRASRTDIAAAAILARALLAQNRAVEAIAPLERAVRRGDDAGMETLLGAAFAGAGRQADAIEQLRKTAARRPPFLPAFKELAGQLGAAGRPEEAIAVLDSALALAPDSLDLQLDLAWMHLMRNARAPARAILARVNQMAPGRPEILAALARIMKFDGDYAAAADLYRQALRLRPDDALTRTDLAACLLELGERDAGEAELRIALRSGPQMLGKAAATLSDGSHGRFFLRPSAVVKFLQRD